MGEPESSNTMKKILSKYMMGIATIPDICKVPEGYRDEKYFVPTLVSIGLSHHDPHNLTLKLKKQFLKNFIVRIGVQMLKKGYLESFNDRLYNNIDAIAEAFSSLEEIIRGFYGDVDPNLLENDEFMKIMLLDGCFVVELFMSHANNKNSTLVGNMAPLATLQQDLLKIENQLPFIVLQTIAGFIPSSENNNINKGNKLVDLALNFFNITKPKLTTNDEPRHLLELVMNALFYKVESYPYSSTIVQVENDEEIEIPLLQEAQPASKLIDYGIKFVPGDSNVLTHVEFDNGIFKIPQIRIEETTMTWYRNFLIFETIICQSKIFTSYIKFMKTLIKTKKDVEVLLDANVIRSSINDADMLASFFENLSAYVNHEDFLFELQIRNVNRYCRTTKPYLRSIFMSWFR